MTLKFSPSDRPHLRFLVPICLFLGVRANADVDSSLSAHLGIENYSSLAALDAQKKFETLSLKGEFSAEYASSFLKPQDNTDSQNGKVSLLIDIPSSPTFAISAANSIRDKFASYGGSAGVSLRVETGGLKTRWTPNLSLKRTSLKINNTSGKSQKKNNTSIVQYGLNQNLELVKSERATALFFYNHYFYDVNITELNNTLSSSNLALKQKKGVASISDQLSTFAQSLFGFSTKAQFLESFEISADYFRTTVQRDRSHSDLLVARTSFELNDKLDVYAQGDFIAGESNSENYTLAFP